MNNINEEQALKELNIEDFLALIFIGLGILSIYGDQIQKEYIKTKDNKYEQQANSIFDFILIITFFLYIFFLYRNYKSYQNAPPEKKELFSVKLLASCFLLSGIICSIYFQLNNKKFTGIPAI